MESSREPGGDVHVEMLNLSFIINLVFIVLDGSIFGARASTGKAGASAVNLVYVVTRETRAQETRRILF